MDWSQIMSEALKLVVMIVLGLISAYVVPWINAKKAEVSAKAEAEGWQTTLNIIEKFVASAEQLANTNELNGEWKKNYVCGLIEDTLNIDITPDIEAYIESAVIKLHNELFPNET